MRGGIYPIGGSCKCSLNVTYNYAPFFRKAFADDDGIRCLYGSSGAVTIPLLERAIASLADDATENYWDPTEGNAKRALHGLLAFARLRPDGVWQGD
jgi:hypothetical protein